MKILDLFNDDPVCSQMLADYMQAKDDFTRYTDKLPERERTLLWKFPGEGYFLHHNIIKLVCEHMRFEDETE